MANKNLIPKDGYSIYVKACIEIDARDNWSCGRHCYYLRYLCEGRRTCTLFREDYYDEYGRKNGITQPELKKTNDDKFLRCPQCREGEYEWNKRGEQ